MMMRRLSLEIPGVEALLRECPIASTAARGQSPTVSADNLRLGRYEHTPST